MVMQMIVKELIEKLKEFDENAQVGMYDCEDGEVYSIAIKNYKNIVVIDEKFPNEVLLHSNKIGLDFFD